LILCVSIVVIGILVRLVLEPVILYFAPGLAVEYGGVIAEIDRLDIELLRGNVSIEGIRLGLPTGQEPESAVDPDDALLLLAGLRAEFEWMDLLDRQIHLASIRLDEPQIWVDQRSDGSLVLPEPPPGDDPPAVETVEKQTESDAPGYTFVLGLLEIEEPQLHLRTQEGREEVVQLGAELFGLEALSVGDEGISLGGITLETPDLYVERDWMLSQAQGEDDAAAAEQDPKPEASSENPTALQIEHLALRSAGFTVRTPDGPLAASIRLTVDDLSLARDHRFPVELYVTLGDGFASADGQLGLNPVFYEGHVAWDELGMPPMLLLRFPELVPWLQSSNAAGDLQMTLRTESGDEPAGLSAKGRASLSDFRFADPESEELVVTWKKLEIEYEDAFIPFDAEHVLSGRRVLDRMRWTQPRITFTNPPDALDRLLAILAGDEPPQEDGASQPADVTRDSDESGGPETTTRLALLEIIDGGFAFVDRGVEPVLRTGVKDFNATASNITLEQATIDRFDLEGVVLPTASFSLTGRLPSQNGSVALDLDELDLTQFDAYARAAGWRLASGATSLESDVTIRGERYSLANDLVVHDLRVDADSPGGFTQSIGVSLDLALALLRDGNGDIALDFPLAIEGDDVGLGLGGLLVEALQVAVKGALASPMKMVGLVGGSGDDAVSSDSIPLPIGETRLPPDVQPRIRSLAGLLNERPALGLKLAGVIAAADEPSISLAMLEEKAARGDSFEDLEGVSFFARRRIERALAKRAAGEPGPLGPDDEVLLRRFVDGQPVPESRKTAFALARAGAVRDALLEAGAPAHALEILPDSIAGRPGVSVELSALDAAPAPGKSARAGGG
jgi:hypothetical protein